MKPNMQYDCCPRLLPGAPTAKIIKKKAKCKRINIFNTKKMRHPFGVTHLWEESLCLRLWLREVNLNVFALAVHFILIG